MAGKISHRPGCASNGVVEVAGGRIVAAGPEKTLSGSLVFQVCLNSLNGCQLSLLPTHTAAPILLAGDRNGGRATGPGFEIA